MTPSGRERLRRLPTAYKFVALVLHRLLRTLTKRDWHGSENLPDLGGCIVTPNHVSYFDPFVSALYLYDNGRPPFYLGKEAVFRIPVLGRLLAATGQIPVYRESGRAVDAFRSGVSAIGEGRTVVVYVEGSLTRDPDLWPMKGKTGAARLALQTRAPVIPLAQWGPQEVMPTYQSRLRVFPRKTMHVLAGPPVDLSDLYDRPADMATVREATDRIMAALTAALEVLRGETAPAVRFDPAAAGLATTGNFKKAARRRGPRWLPRRSGGGRR